MGDGVADPVRILHVDDEPDLAELTATYLERDHERFTVETAESASEGLERLAGSQFDCVVSDHDMPGRNGIEFLEAIRERYPDLPVILFTGKGSEELASDAISAGVTDYLQKERGTSQYTVLANRIANAVEQYRARLARRERRKRRDRQSDALLDLTTDEAVTGGEFETAIARITETAADVLDVARVNVWLFDDGETLRCEDHFERDAASHDSGLELVAEAYPAYFEALEESRSIAADDAIEDPRTAELDDYLEEHDVRSLLDATIRAEGEVVGVVCHEHVGSPREWTEDEVAFASDVADLIHRALRNRDRMERAAELEATQRQFESVFHNPIAFMALLEPDGTVSNANDAALEFVDASLEDVVGASFWDTPWWDHSDVLQSDLRSWIEQAAGGEAVRYEADHHAPDGEVVTLDGVLHPIRDDEGAVTAILAAGRDISDRIENERAINALHGATRELIAASSEDEIADLIAETAADLLDLSKTGIHLYEEDADELVPAAWTDALAETIGEPPSLGRDSLAWEAFETGETQVHDELDVNESVQNPETPLESELIVPLGRYGVVIAAAENRNAFDSDDHRLIEVLCANATAALDRVSREQLLRRRELELEEKNDRLEEFASVVSHELRNPLNVAEGRLEYAAADPDSKHYDAVENAHDRMRTLIEDLLTLARQEKRVTEREPVDLAATAEACYANVETGDAALAIETDRTVLADESRLMQVFENLFRNAVEHGHGDVTVTVGDLADGFYVEDDGPGIPEAKRSDVLESGYSTSETGTGFGLRIVEQVVEAHGWDIVVTEGSTGGARFEVTGVDFGAE